MRMRIAVAADHGGFSLKAPLVQMLLQAGHEVADLGAHSDERSDYPDFSKAVGEALQQDKADRGIVICGSGVGACVAANKMRGIRACVCHDTYSAHQGVEHDDMNVLVLGARVIGVELAYDIVRAFLGATFNNGDRYIARLKKIEAMERGACE
jgi:ribose 5-phosphate isomerase B